MLAACGVIFSVRGVVNRNPEGTCANVHGIFALKLYPFNVQFVGLIF